MGLFTFHAAWGARSEEIGKPREAGNSSDRKSETGDIQDVVKE